MNKSLLFLPGPVPVAQPVLAAMARPMVNHRGPAFAAQLERVSRRLQGVFGTQGPVLLLGSSGTGGLEAAVASMFSPGDVVLSCPVGVFGKRLAAIAQTYGCEVELLETPIGSALDPDQLAARLHADTEKRIRGVLLTHNETSSGVQNDMAALAPIVRDHGALSVVDSVSGLAASEFRMDDWGYDVVVSASQKALAAPPGLAMVALGKRAVSQLERAAIPRFYFDLKRALESAANGQTPWTPPISIVYALDVALDLYESGGASAAWARHDLYARAIRAALEALGFTIVSQPNAHSVTVVAAYPPQGVDATEFLKTLSDRHGVVLSSGQAELTGKIVRMGTMGDVAQTDLLGAIAAIEMTLQDGECPVEVGAGVRAALRVLLDRAALAPA